MKLVRQKVVDTAVEAVGDVGTDGARRATSVPTSPAPAETEVLAKAQRRRFSAGYKRRIVREADRCVGPGDIGALLRREGLYSSLLATWRAARDRGELEGLMPKKRGPKVNAPDPRDRQLLEQMRETARWKNRAERAEALVEVQKKLAILLGTPLDDEKS
jgi:transposase